MSKGILSLIILEDDAAHAYAMILSFEDSDPPVEILVAQTLREYCEHVAVRAPDIALLNLNLPDADSMDVIALLSTNHPFPVLVTTSFGNEAMAVAAMKAGLLKKNCG